MNGWRVGKDIRREKKDMAPTSNEVKEALLEDNKKTSVFASAFVLGSHLLRKDILFKILLPPIRPFFPMLILRFLEFAEFLLDYSDFLLPCLS